MGTAIRFLVWFGLGLAFSIRLGGALTPYILLMIRNNIVEKAKERGEVIDKLYFENLEIPDWLVGTVERVFFTILVAFNISGTATAMIGWVTIKMLTDWHRILKPDAGVGLRSLAFSALLGNMISLFFALIGGLICRFGL
jgi:hypothetical protein